MATKSPGPGAPHLDADVAQMRALAHPLRLRIMELFAEAPRTTKQVAELLDQPPTRLYHHVAALERAGLLRLKETRKNRGTVEKWYESVARTLGGATTKRNSDATTRRAMVVTLLEQARQEMTEALGAPNIEAPLLARLVLVGPTERNVAMRKRLMAFLRELQAEFGQESPHDDEAREDVERWALTLAFAPASPRRRG